MLYKGREREYQCEWARKRRRAEGIKPRTVFNTNDERKKAHALACRRYRLKHLKEVRASARKWAREHPVDYASLSEEQRQAYARYNLNKYHRLALDPAYRDKIKDLARKHRAKRILLWRGQITNNGLGSTIWKEAEILACEVLKKEGFVDIHKHSRILHGSFDILAKQEDGRIFCFEVTTQDKKKLDSEAFFLARYLNLTYYVLFVKPDLSGKYLMKIASNRRGSLHPSTILSLDEIQHLKQL